MSNYTTPDKKHYTVAEQESRLPLYLREFYAKRQLDRVTIDGNEIQGYFEYSFSDEKSYIKEPVRSASGTIDNLNSYATFLTPRLVIKYNYMHINDYRKLMQLLNSKNEFVVECYDIVLDKRVKHKMYHATPQMPTIHQRNLEVLGIRDYTIELIGTNTDFSTIDILYYDMNGTLIESATQTVEKGTYEVIGYDYLPPIGYRFEGQWENEQGTIYNNGEAIFINQGLQDNDEAIKLFAKVVPTNEYTLSFAYGNGMPLNTQSAGAVVSIPIKEGETIQSAIARANITLDNGSKFSFPENGTGGQSVLYENEYIVPYEFKGWYWTTEIPKTGEDTKVYSYTTYNKTINSTIFQIYAPKNYKVTFVTNTDQIKYDDQSIAYGSIVPLPALRMSGYTFIGWYTDITLKNAFSGTMPPKDITLYAKWEKNK